MIGAYARVSTRHQAERKTIESQKTDILAYCALRGEQVGEWFTDDGTTSRKPLEKRAGGARLFDWARAGKLTKLIVFMYDRLGRDDEDVTTLVHMGELRKLGVSIESVKEGASDDPHGRFASSIMILAGGMQRAQIQDRARKHAREWARKGAYQGGPAPFGYRVVDRADKRRELAWATDPMPGFEDPPLSEKDVVAKVFGKVADGASQQTVADWLNGKNISPHPEAQAGMKPKGKRTRLSWTRKDGSTFKLATRWKAERIGKLVRDRIYKGEGHYGERKTVWKDGDPTTVKRTDPKELAEIIPMSWPPIVPAELWERANAALRSHNNQLRAHAGNPYLLAGLIRCGTCGQAYVGFGKKFYRCRRHYAYKLDGLTAPCPSKNVYGSKLEGDVLEELKAFFRRPPAVVVRGLQAANTDEKVRADMLQEIKRLERLLSGQEAERDRLVTLDRKGFITEAQFEKQYHEMEAEKAGYDSEIARLRKELNDSEARQRGADEAVDLLTSLRGKIECFEEQRKAAQALVEVTIQTGADGRPYADVTYRFERQHKRQRDFAYANATPGGAGAKERLSDLHNAQAMAQSLSPGGVKIW
jgi:site-specific DNA recombinase